VKGSGTSRPLRTTPMVRAPSPTKANCPSDSWPAHPVSIVMGRAAMATMRMSVHRNCWDRSSRKKGSTPRKVNSAANPKRGSQRTYQRSRRRSGMGRIRYDSDHPASSRPLRTTNRTSTSVATKR
jgi:hypothetical protein